MNSARMLNEWPDDFVSADLTIRRQPPGRLAVLTYRTIVGLIIAGTIVACFAHVDRIVTARGTLTTIVSPTSIRPLETTETKQILVYPGERVRAGQLLVRFDRSLDEAAFETLTIKGRSLAREIVRLGREIEAGTAGYAKSVGSDPQGVLQEDRSDARRAHLVQLATQAASARASLRASIIAVDADRQTANLEAAKFSVFRKLYATGYIPELQYVAGYESMLQSRSALARDTAAERAAQIASTQISAQAAEFDSAQHAQTISQYIGDQRDENDTIGQLRREQHLLALSDVRAPFDASIVDVAPQNGTAVASTQPLVTLVPLNTPLQAEAYVDNKDIGYLRVGLPVRVKLDAFPFERQGWVEGHIRIIAHDSVGSGTAAPEISQPSDTSGSSSSNATRYRVTVTLDRILLRDVAKPELLPGMMVECDMIVGRQSVASYLLEPIVRSFGNAFSEPNR
jgi:HlyD family secretion protein